MRLRTSAANGVIKLSNLFYICAPCGVWLGQAGTVPYRQTVRAHPLESASIDQMNNRAPHVTRPENKEKNTSENDINILDLILRYENIFCFI